MTLPLLRPVRELAHEYIGRHRRSSPNDEPVDASTAGWSIDPEANYGGPTLAQFREDGPMTLTIDLNTNQAVGSGHQHRPIIRKPNGAAVPAYSFLDPTFAPVSAIWATDLDASWIIGNAKPMAVVHNPGATRPVPLGLLPAQDEYSATPNGPDEYALERRPGRLAQV